MQQFFEMLCTAYAGPDHVRLRPGYSVRLNDVRDIADLVVDPARPARSVESNHAEDWETQGLVVDHGPEPTDYSGVF